MILFDIGYPKPFEYRLLLVYFLATGLATSYILGLPFVLVDPEFSCVKTDEQGQIITFSCTQEEACSNGYKFEIDRTNSISSIVLEYDLICDQRYLADLIGSFTFLGELLGFMIYTFFYDNQRDALITAVRTIFHAGLWAFLSVLAWGPYSYMAFRFIFSFFYSGLQVLAYSHLVEMTSYNPVFMNFCIILLNISWGIGQTYIGVLCSFYFDWRWSLSVYNGIPLIILSFYFWKLKAKQAEYDQIREGELAMVRIHHKKQNTSTYNNVWKVLSYKSLRSKTIISTILFLLINLSYFGTIFSIGSLGGSIYLDMVLMAIFEILSYVISGWITPYCRRKLALMLVFLINFTVFFLFLWAGVEDISNISQSVEYYYITLALIGRFFICSSYMFFYVYYAELMPKSVIRTTFGLSNVIFALGLSYMPWMITKLKVAGCSPFFSFSIINLAAFFCMWFLPETKGDEVQEITEEEINAERGAPLIELPRIAKLIRGK